jgi:hypothetical protein
MFLGTPGLSFLSCLALTVMHSESLWLVFHVCYPNALNGSLYVIALTRKVVKYFEIVRIE